MQQCCYLPARSVFDTTFTIEKITVATLTIKIINKSDNPLPAYETSGSAGMDIRANLEQPVKLKPMQRSLLPTGLFLELPE